MYIFTWKLQSSLCGTVTYIGSIDLIWKACPIDLTPEGYIVWHLVQSNQEHDLGQLAAAGAAKYLWLPTHARSCLQFGQSFFPLYGASLELNKGYH